MNSKQIFFANLQKGMRPQPKAEQLAEKKEKRHRRIVKAEDAEDIV